MCGIVGMVGFSDVDLLRKMMDIISYRGPDDSGTYTDGYCAIGNRRLSIIDLAYGHQPIHNEDETVFTVYNGEIYNFKKLRERLEKRGHSFYTNSDTEVLVHLYEDYGREMLHHLDGMYAICIWDAKERRMLLARDPIGIKPLHYVRLDDGLLFGSEVKSLLQYEGLEPKVNRYGIWAFLNQGFIPNEQTMFSDILRLRPGHYLIWDEKKRDFSIKRHWGIKIGNVHESIDYYKKRVRALLEKAVEKRLYADVPVGFFLSGGSDSTAVVALARHMYPDQEIVTFTMQFVGNETEVREARRIAELYETKHHEDVCEYDAAFFYDKAIWHTEEPRINIMYNLMLSEYAKNYVKVILTGVGGDELFAGYDRNRLAWRMRHVPRIMPAWVGRLFPFKGEFSRRVRQVAATCKHRKRFFINFMPTAPLRDSELNMWTGGEGHSAYLYDSFIDEQGSMVDAYLKAQLLTYLPENLLLVLDRETMASSIEGRLPLCDVDLTELAFKIPYKYKVRSYKHIFGLAVADLVPRETFRKKVGVFGAKSHDWFERGLKEIANQRLDKVQAPYISQEYIDNVLDIKEKTGRQYEHLWNLLAYESWYRMFILGEGVGGGG